MLYCARQWFDSAWRGPVRLVEDQITLNLDPVHECADIRLIADHIELAGCARRPLPARASYYQCGRDHVTSPIPLRELEYYQRCSSVKPLDAMAQDSRFSCLFSPFVIFANDRPEHSTQGPCKHADKRG